MAILMITVMATDTTMVTVIEVPVNSPLARNGSAFASFITATVRF